jgi:hypothetical protein
MAKAKRPARSQRKDEPKQRAVLIKMDDEVRNELEVLSLGTRKSFQELGLEAICDLLKKYGRPVSLLDAFKKSAAKKPGRKPARKRRARR